MGHFYINWWNSYYAIQLYSGSFWFSHRNFCVNQEVAPEVLLHSKEGEDLGWCLHWQHPHPAAAQLSLLASCCSSAWFTSLSLVHGIGEQDLLFFLIDLRTGAVFLNNLVLRFQFALVVCRQRSNPLGTGFEKDEGS